MVGDITILEQSSMTSRGSRMYPVAAGATAIYAGEPVVVSGLGGAQTVEAAATATPVVGTDYVVGIAQTNSTQTASVAGVVDVLPLTSGTTYLINATDATAVDTQAEYDALVGSRLVFDLTTGVYTLDTTTDGATNGCVVVPLDINRYPGKVAFAFRDGANYLA